MEAPRPARAALRRRVRIAAIAALALIAAGAVIWTVVRDHPAETVVKDFFTALQAKDVDAALALVAESGMPDGNSQPSSASRLATIARFDRPGAHGPSAKARETIAFRGPPSSTRPTGVQHGRYEARVGAGRHLDVGGSVRMSVTGRSPTSRSSNATAR